MAWRKQQEQQTGAGPEEAQTFEWTAKQPENLDDILADIDEVLETNAEEFVRSFVQKGGQ